MGSWRIMYVSGLHSFQLSLKVYHRPLQQAVTFAETSHRCAYHHLGVLAKYGCSEKRRQLITTKSGHLDSTTAEAAAERGLRILRERSDAMKQDDAMEAWRSLLEAACAESVPGNVYFALGNLHYIWGDLLKRGRNSELGAERAARAVIAEIKQLRKQVTRERHRGKATEIEGRRKEEQAFTISDEVKAQVDHPEAWEWYLKAADQGDSRAMMQLGEIATESIKTVADADLAIEWYQKAACGEPYQPDALFQIARIHHEGIGIPTNLARARELYEEACEAGSSTAAFFLGHRYHVGDEDLGIVRDGQRALQLLTKASEQGHSEAMFYLAQAYRSGSPEMGIARELDKFSEMVQQAAGAGSADALFALGGVFFHGDDGFPRDSQMAFKHYSAAAAQGHADASYCLGVMYYTTGDFEAAFHCYQAAAESGNMLAWRNLASMYALGEGVARSEQMAKHIMTTLRDKIELQEKSEEGNGRGQGDTGQADR